MRTRALRLGAGQENDGVGVDVAVDRHVALVDDTALSFNRLVNESMATMDPALRRYRLRTLASCIVA